MLPRDAHNAAEHVNKTYALTEACASADLLGSMPQILTAVRGTTPAAQETQSASADTA